MDSITKKYNIVSVIAGRCHSDYDGDDVDVDVQSGGWGFRFEYDERMAGVLEGQTWEELCAGPVLAKLAAWAERCKPEGDDWIYFHFYTLWELHFIRSYSWEYAVYEYDSEAYCIGLLDDEKWTPENLGLVDAVQYD